MAMSYGFKYRCLHYLGRWSEDSGPEQAARLRNLTAVIINLSLHRSCLPGAWHILRFHTTPREPLQCQLLFCSRRDDKMYRSMNDVWLQMAASLGSVHLSSEAFSVSVSSCPPCITSMAKRTSHPNPSAHQTQAKVTWEDKVALLQVQGWHKRGGLCL